ncbi:MAG: Crp/Fnr family transcriptional regulator [Burkholderiales bacterium]|nr:Crp/Fnr family transcriptional regulator [Burkholderiales bacterium]
MFPPVPTPIHRFLQTQTWFTALPAARRDAIEAQVSTLSAARGQIMLPANERTQGWYGVVEGLIKISGRSKAGRRSDFLGVAAGDWFGEGAVLKNELRRYEVVALRDTVLLCLPSAVFHELAATSLGFNQYLVACMNLRLSQAMAMIEAERTRNPEQRIAVSLSRLFWSRTRQLDLTQDELANLAGMSRQTANRALNALQERGLISLALNRIKVLDDAALTGLLDEPPADHGGPP